MPTTSARRSRFRHVARFAAAAVGVGALVAGSVLASTPAAADSKVSPVSGKFLIKGAGHGHGHGMSQYGAYGAATKGKTYTQILSFYYPGTTLRTMPSGTTIKVWVTADNDNNLKVLPSRGLKVRDADGRSLTLPTGSRYKLWRVTRSGSGYRLAWRDASGDWTTRSTGLGTGTWSLSTSAKVVRVRMPSGSTREYRGSVALVKRGSGARTVNKVLLEDYVRSVVPSEMPTSWSIEAVKAQAVAARSYAVRLRDFTNYDGYDICDTTVCQVYSGMAVTPSGGRRVLRETAGGDTAVRGTAGRIVTYRGKVALTQFAASNGGAMSSGGYPYLRAKRDPYDGVVKSQAWSRTITTASLARAYPSAGTVRQLQITSRDGSGPWGGRVKTITIIGSNRTVTVTGSAFQSKFGMRSSLYTVTRP